MNKSDNPADPFKKALAEAKRAHQEADEAIPTTMVMVEMATNVTHLASW